MSGRIDQVLHYHLRFYQLLGMHSLPLAGDERVEHKTKLWKLWAVIPLSCFSGVAIMCLTSDDEYLYKGDHFGWFNDGLKYGFAELAVLCIYGETLFQGAPVSRFWQNYARIAAPPAKTWWLQVVQHSRFLVTLYGTLFLELLMVSLLGCLQELSHHIWLFWTTFQPFVMLVHLRNTQFVLYLELLRQQLLQLERELALLVEYSGFASGAASFPGFEDYLRRRLRQKQLIYERIYELWSNFSQAFSYSVLTVLLMIYIRVAVDCYFMYYTIYNNIDNIDYYLLLPALLEIPAFIYASQSCMQMVPRIAYQLHNIVVTSPDLSLQVQNFSLQILHQPMRIDCLGITILDSYLLTRIACAVCTYMIFTVQLMPKLSGSFS